MSGADSCHNAAPYVAVGVHDAEVGGDVGRQNAQPYVPVGPHDAEVGGASSLQNASIGNLNPAADPCLGDSINELQEGRTITMYCKPNQLKNAERERYQLQGTMTSCELLIEEKSRNFLPG